MDTKQLKLPVTNVTVEEFNRRAVITTMHDLVNNKYYHALESCGTLLLVRIEGTFMFAIHIDEVEDDIIAYAANGYFYRITGILDEELKSAILVGELVPQTYFDNQDIRKDSMDYGTFWLSVVPFGRTMFSVHDLGLALAVMETVSTLGFSSCREMGRVFDDEHIVSAGITKALIAERYEHFRIVE